MSSPKSILSSELAEFLRVIGKHRAHWYRVFDPSDDEVNKDIIRATFPSFATLMLLPKEIVEQLFIHLGLAKQRQHMGVYKLCPDADAWERFIAEHQLNLESTVFAIQKKKHLYIRVGCWSMDRHPNKTPDAIWKLAALYPVPKLRISTLAIRFSVRVGEFFSGTPSGVVDSSSSSGVSGGDGGMSSDSEEEQSRTPETDDEENSENVQNEMVVSPSNSNEAIASETVSSSGSSNDIPDSKEYPLLHQYGVPIQCKSVMDKLLQEVVKFHGGRKIEYTQISQKKGLLLRVQSASSKHLFSKTLRRKGNFLDEMLEFIASSIKDVAMAKIETAAEWLISALFQKYEDQFVSVAVSKGVTVLKEKIMDAPKVQAMLNESGINLKSSRVLFRHLNQFFGRSVFASEGVRRQYFEGLEFNPTTGTFRFWY